MEEYYIAWWNVENLFDVEGQVEPHRPEYLQKKLKKELKDWTAAVLDTKIGQLVKIISQMNNGDGPDLLGLCEIENKNVVTLLMNALQFPGRDYDIIHHNMEDKRGIDIAFIYDKNKFAIDPDKIFNHTIQLNYATRELFQVTFTTTAKDNQFVVIGNHWPSRLGEEWARLAAGSALGHWVKRINEELGEGTAVLAMGDFNDEPFNQSLVKAALSVQHKTKVTRGKKHYLYNPMWKLMGEGKTSYVYSGSPNMLDQFLLNKGIIKADAPLRYKAGSADVLRFPEMEKGSYKQPRRFDRPSKPKTFDPEGFSDHFPIIMILQES